tara:strand:+ start:684 stop:872 length:189 start_codon:yes stop_codon:yes gene_type:complete
LADAFGVTLDYLIDDKKMPNILQNQAMLTRWTEIDSLETPEQERILSLVRDAKARQAYRMSA